jgi:hypothetical protein
MLLAGFREEVPQKLIQNGALDARGGVERSLRLFFAASSEVMT